jgi:eukaryotic-like serine/threonine-protein kinase
MANAPSAGVSLPPRYRYEGPVAAGGMAMVYAAHDEVLDRPVAVKVLAEHLSEDDAARQRFQREARAAAALSSHPNVVTVFDVGEHEGRSFIVMELRRGGTIGDVMAKGKVPQLTALQWLRDAASALDAAHEGGVTHRDIKPANLLLDEHQRLAVADFGIARLAWEQQVTATGQVLGTAAYLSPEQATGEPATAASDRYALAVVAFELLTGRRPFEAEHFAAQARAHIEDPPPPSGLGADVDAVLQRGLAKDPSERWPSATAFVDALRDALEAEQKPAPTTKFMGAPAAAAPPPPPRRTAPRATVAPAARPRRSSSRWLAPAVIALLAVIAVIAIIGAAGDGDGAQRAESTPEPTATAKAEDEKKEEPKKEATPEPTAAATEAAPESTPADAELPTGSISELDAKGYDLIQAGQYAEAVPYERAAVEQCGDSTETICSYAIYNLGTALNRSGNPAEAIPYLQRRLDGWPDDRPQIVRAELRSACKAAGQKCK